MDLRLRLETPRLPAADVVVTVSPHARVADLAAALARQRGVDDAMNLYCHRHEAWLPPNQLVGEARLRQGERLALLATGTPPPHPPRTPPAAMLFVTGGTATGLRFPLPAGTHTVGRSPDCAVTISDPAISRAHLNAQVAPGGAVVVTDAGSSGGTFLDGDRLQGPTAVRPGQEVELGRSLICFLPPVPDAAPQPDASGTIPFNRPPRAVPSEIALEFTVPSPPRRTGLAAMSFTGASVPLLMGALMYYASGRQPVMLLMALLSPMMVIGSYFEGWIGNRRGNRRSVRRFRGRMQQLDAEVAEAFEAETRRRRQAAPSVALMIERARALQPSLWERRPHHPDFLQVRAGWGDLPSGVTIGAASGSDDDDLPAWTGAITSRYGTFRSVPLSVPLADVGSTAVVGDRERVLAMGRSLVGQVVGLHSPKEVQLVAAISGGDRDHWRWLGWLPHAQPEAPAAPGRSVVAGPLDSRELLERLLRLVDERRRASTSSGTNGQVATPVVMALLDEEADLPRASVDRLLSLGPDCGVPVLWLGRYRATVPGSCRAVIELDPTTAAPTLTLPGSGEVQQGHGADLVSPAVVDELARCLAPVRDMEVAGQQAGIPSYVSLLELLDLTADPVVAVVRRWERDDGRLSARMGMGAGGQPCELSLRQDGPHALAGGMTGAGKSELLQSLVASLASSHSPSRLTFILIDYKGGAAFKDCVGLPHTVGFVTDLDGRLVGRALTSLRAELRRREHVLREHGCKDLVDLEQRAPDAAFPSLLIVVDEFAALVTELPEFVDGMVDVAQRGRSLGIHLVLATQRPAGIISDRIRTNTNLRISLRFSDADDSRDVIGTDEAARPGLPRGRAFARTGPGSVIEFQAAHASGSTATGADSAPIVVRAMDIEGRPVAAEETAGERDHDAPSDLMRVVEAAVAAASRLALPPPARPWLPTLPVALPLDHVDQPDTTRAGRAVAYGTLDDPARQRQAPSVLDLDREGSLVAYGASGSGKTTLLRTLAVALASRFTPDDVHLYCLDYASRGLRPLSALPHCGGVIAADEPDRALRLLRMLRRELEERKARFAASGATSLAEYRSMTGQPLPSIVVLLDGYSVLTSAFEEVDLGAPLDELRSLVGEGRPLGLVFAITADRSNAVPAALMAAVGRRLVLRMANEDEYMYLGLPRAQFQGAALPAGRAFDDGGMELQCAIAGADPSGAAQAAAIERVGAELAARFREASVPEVRTLPANLPAGELPVPSRPLEAVLGLRDDDLGPARVDLGEGHLVVAGPRRSGRTTVIAACATSLARAGGAPPRYLLSPRRSGLGELPGWTEAAVGPDACADLAGRLQAALGAGQEEVDGIDLARGAVVLVDDGDELFESSAAPALEAIAQRGGERGVRLVAAVETQAAHRTFGGWLFQLQRDRQTLLLDPDPSIDGALAGGVRLPARRGRTPAGRGCLVVGGQPVVVQVARP